MVVDMEVEDMEVVAEDMEVVAEDMEAGVEDMEEGEEDMEEVVEALPVMARETPPAQGKATNLKILLVLGFLFFRHDVSLVHYLFLFRLLTYMFSNTLQVNICPVISPSRES